MKLKTTETIAREVEISLPAFFDVEYSVIKLISETKAVSVSYRYCVGITIYDGYVPDGLLRNMKPEDAITEEQFEQRLLEVRERVYSFIQQGEEVLA